MTTITALAKDVTSIDLKKATALHNALQAASNITTSDVTLVNAFVDNMTGSDLKGLRKKIRDLLKVLVANKSGSKDEEDEDDEDSDDEEADAGNNAKAPEASQAEINVIKNKLIVKASSKASLDSSKLDTWCKRGEVIVGDIAEASNIMNQVMYLGFQWLGTFDELRNNAQVAGVTKDMFIYHMKFFCALYLERGSNYLDKGLKTLKDKDMKNYITAMSKVYKIVKRRPAKGYGPHDATLTRIVAIFPELVAQIIKDANKIPIANEAAPGLARWYKFPGGASLIKTSEVEKYKLWLVWYKAFGTTINRGVEPKEAEVKRYGDAIHTSRVTGEAERDGVSKWA